MTPTRYRAAFLAACLALAVVAAGCGSSGDDDTAQAGAAIDGCQETAKIKFAVPTDPPKFAQVTPRLAEKLGLFDKQCLDVEITSYKTGTAALRALQAGEAQLALPAANNMIVAAGQGSPIVAVGSPASKLPQLILATKGISRCEDLKGKSVATGGPGDLVDFLMKTYLASCGLVSGKDVKVFVGAPGDFGPQLAQGVVQASALHIDDQPLIQEKYKTELTVLKPASELVPDFGFQLITARADFLKNKANRDAVARFNAAILGANKFLVDPANKAKAIELAAAATTRSPEIITYAYEKYAALFPDTCEKALSEKSIAYTAKTQVDAGELKKAPDYDAIVDADLCAASEKLVKAP